VTELSPAGEQIAARDRIIAQKDALLSATRADLEEAVACLSTLLQDTRVYVDWTHAMVCEKPKGACECGNSFEIRKQAEALLARLLRALPGMSP
jgi:hypothetical protein